MTVLSICDKSCSAQVRDLILSDVTHIFWMIWYARNQLRFNDQVVSVSRAIHFISAVVSLSGKVIKGAMSSSICEFQILKHFKVEGNLPKAPFIIQVDWHKPPCGWIKCNSDGTSKGNPGQAASGGIFRDSSGAIAGCFAEYIGVASFFFIQNGLLQCNQLRLLSKRGWRKLWLEYDSLLVVHSFKNIALVP